MLKVFNHVISYSLLVISISLAYKAHKFINYVNSLGSEKKIENREVLQNEEFKSALTQIKATQNKSNPSSLGAQQSNNSSVFDLDLNAPSNATEEVLFKLIQNIDQSGSQKLQADFKESIAANNYSESDLQNSLNHIAKLSKDSKFARINNLLLLVMKDISKINAMTFEHANNVADNIGNNADSINQKVFIFNLLMQRKNMGSKQLLEDAITFSKRNNDQIYIKDVTNIMKAKYPEMEYEFTREISN